MIGKLAKVGSLKNMNLDLEYFEKVIARQSMVDSSYLNAIADYVKPEFFEDKRIAKYFEIVKDFHDRRNELPTITEIKTYLTDDSLKEGFRQLVASFKEIDKNLNKDELYENTERFLKEKSVYNTLLKVASELSEGIVDTSKILTQFESSCNINLISDKGMELFCDASLLIDDILNVESCISSGWEWLDNALGGGYRENGKGLYVYAGQANIGKSIFLGNTAINIAKQNKSVLVITLEMSEMLYAKRMSSNLTSIPLNQFESSTDSIRSILAKRKREIPDGKIFIKEFPPSTITPKQLAAFVKKFKESGERVDAIVIDYINLLHSTIGSNSYERVKYICEQVRAMSYQFACPIISATQLNRSAYNTNNPGMEGLSESIGLAATADVIISIFQNEEDQDMNIIRLGMMKNRYGPRGMVQLMKINYDTLTIEQSDEDCTIHEDENISLLEKFAN
jgi:replicative DNA helicase